MSRFLVPRDPIHGRGTQLNPPNRFDRVTIAEDPDLEPAPDEDAPGRPRTEYLRDASRTAIAYNQSPDVFFEASLNPYRGCSHGCVYCVSPDTPVLGADLVWRPIGEARVGDQLLGFDEFPLPGRTRKFRKAVVLGVRWSRQPTLRLVTSRSEVHTTAGHRWLQDRSFRWSCAHQLKPGRRLRHVPFTASEEFGEDYRLGYLAGMSLGDGTFRYEPGWRSDKLGFPPAYWRVALVDDEPLHRLVEYLATFGVDVPIRPFDGGPSARKRLKKVETRSLGKLAVIHGLLGAERSSRDYARGFLAGFFDAEGSHGDSLRFSQLDLRVLERVRCYAGRLGFTVQLEPREGRASTARLVGKMTDRIRFFSVCRPAIRRKIDAICGFEMNLEPEPVEAVEAGRRRDVVDIQTSTGTFYAAGLATHNCFARPTHETLGFSSGLDFETKIVVKEDAPDLLRKELAHPGWKPQVIAVSGVTDAYQPIERKLGLTRRCLEVLADFRNPVAIVTKNALVARDADVLAELARFGAAAVFVSLTSLDGELQRTMEPRTSPPFRRLEAVRRLTDAGVPAGVILAPMIPALNDHEIPALLEAAADAGARFASYVPLRLPYAVKELFVRWLADHYPDRKEKVLSRIRDLRDGKLNDPSFGTRLRGSGAFADEIATLFEIARRKAGLADRRLELSTAAFRRPQLELFGSPPAPVSRARG